MPKILDDIRNQPTHIRHIFMWLCVAIVGSAVSYLWLRSTAHEFVALVNPAKIEQERALAEADKKNNQQYGSLFANISDSTGSIRAGLAAFIGFGNDQNKTYQFIGNYSGESVPPKLFPLSKNKTVR